MIDKFLNIFRIPDLRKKLVFTSLILLVYRLGGHITIPGINMDAVEALMTRYAGLSLLLIQFLQ